MSAVEILLLDDDGTEPEPLDVDEIDLDGRPPCAECGGDGSVTEDGCIECVSSGRQLTDDEWTALHEEAIHGRRRHGWRSGR